MKRRAEEAFDPVKKAFKRYNPNEIFRDEVTAVTVCRALFGSVIVGR